jgi:hypothetical protein
LSIEATASGWTVETLKTVVDQRFADADRRYQQRFESQERALEQARLASEKRLDGMNEFRQALTDASSKYITRQEAYAMIIAACAITGTLVEAANFFMKR